MSVAERIDMSQPSPACSKQNAVRWTLALAVAMLLSLLAPSAKGQAVSRMARLYQADGKQRPARIIRITDDWQIEFEEKDGTRFSLGVERVARWGTQREPSGPYVVLLDGGVAAGDILSWDEQRISIGIDYELFVQRSVWEPSSLSLTRVSGVVVQPPAKLKTRDAIDVWMREEDVRSDRIWMINGDRLPGSIRGVAESDDVISDRILQFTAAGRDAGADLELVRAVALKPTTGRSPSIPSDAKVVRLAFRDGSSINARAINSTGGEVRITTVGGATLTTTPARFIRQLEMLQAIRSPKFDYLSDLKPIGYRHIPFLTISWPDYGTDRNLLGGPLRSVDGWSAKGLAMHTTSRIAFDLDDKYEKFEAELAIDAGVGQIGSARFRVYLDTGDGKFAPAYSSDVIRGGAKPQPISVKVAGARRMALIVDFADRGDAGDHANWLNARLIRRRD